MSVAAIDLVELTVEQVQHGFASGAFTCEQLVRACLDRIAEYDPHYNAIIFRTRPPSMMRARSTGAAPPARRWGRSPACRSWSRTRWT